MMKRKLFLALAFCMIFACSNGQVLYKVEGNGLQSASYLFGTHHLASIKVIEQFGATGPFESCTQVVGEIDMRQDPMKMGMVMQQHMMAPADSTLSVALGAYDFNSLNEEFKKWAPMPGMTLAMLEPMKPMAVSTMIAVNMSKAAMPDFDANDQLDSWFQLKGSEQGKTVIPLETVEEQASVLFDTMPISYQAEALADVLNNPEKALKSSQDLTAAYLKQDLAEMERLSKEENEHPDFMKALLDRRNANWLAQLPGIFNEGPTFVAVGALHLAGDKGLVEGLRKLGYTVTVIKAEN